MSAEQSSVNSETIEKTKQQIRTIVSEISQMSKSDVDAEQYYAAFLQRVISALAAIGGAIWLINEGRLQLVYQISMDDGLLDGGSPEASRHLRLLQRVLPSQEGALVPPLSGTADDEGAGNPTRFLLVLCPLRGDGSVEGLVEVFQRPDAPPATQRGYLRFLQQMCELAGEWLKTQKLRQFSDRHSLWAQVDQFSRMIHESLDLRETAYAVANEGRRLVGCDRVSVAVMKGRKCVVEAVSGQDTIEQRSNAIAALNRLATKAVATGEPVRYEGATEDFPPQIEKAIEDYVDESHARSLIILPLRRPKDPNAGDENKSTGYVEREEDHIGDVIGALIIEQIETDLPKNVLEPRVDLVYEHSTRALANAMDHSTLFLMPLWRMLGKASWVIKARTLPKTLAVTGLILAIILILTFVKKDFNLKANGALQPVVRKDVFVEVGGTVSEVLVKDQQSVKEGDVLVVLDNTDVQLQLTDVEGTLQATLKQLNSARDALARQSNLSEDERIRLFGQVAELTEQQKSLEAQRRLLREKMAKLTIRSPATGIVLLSWDFERSLKHRPVEVGQVLMSVADPTGEWELELFMPERRMGHVDLARREVKKADPNDDLQVKYVLATDPDQTRIGKIKHVERITQMHEEEGHTVRIRVAVDRDEIPDPRPGATVTAKVCCGRRAIGYAWFHEALEWVQANVLF